MPGDNFIMVISCVAVGVGSGTIFWGRQK